MRRPLFGILAIGALLLAGTTVLAQGVITDIKTPPLQASDVIILEADFHPGVANPPWRGWAGARIAMHILDNTEMDVVGITPVPGGIPLPTITNPFGPASNNSESVVKFFTGYLPTPPSGINVVPSVNVPIFDITIHVKNSNPSGNSDRDAQFFAWNIWHVRGGPGSTLTNIPGSWSVLVNSQFTNQEQFHVPGVSYYQFPSNPPTPHNPDAHWLHLFGGVFHLPGGPGSTFLREPLNSAFLGIEHVPEPSGALLGAAGLACAAVGGWMRRRRRKRAAIA